MINLNAIIEAVIALIAAIITYKVIPWIKAKTTEQQRATLNAIVSTLVFAAEQIYGAGHGNEKLEYVRQELEERGLTFDRAVIEAAVHDANWFKVLEEDSAEVDDADD